jgi:hypothetical protein
MWMYLRCEAQVLLHKCKILHVTEMLFIVFSPFLEAALIGPIIKFRSWNFWYRCNLIFL